MTKMKDFTQSKAKTLLNLIEKNKKKFNIIRTVVIVLTAGYMLPFFAEVLSSLLVVDFGYEWARCIGFMPYNFYSDLSLIIFLVCYIVFFATLLFRTVVEHFALKTKEVKKCLKVYKKIEKWNDTVPSEGSGVKTALQRLGNTPWYYFDERQWAYYLSNAKAIILAADVNGHEAKEIVEEINILTAFFNESNANFIKSATRARGDRLIEREYRLRDEFAKA